MHGETNINETTPYNWTEDIAYDCVGGMHFQDLPYVIPANLSAGELILEGYIGGGATITDTVQRGGRDTVHVKTDSDDTYWDREKGVLLEYDYNATDGTMTMKIAGTNVWISGFLGLDLDWWVWAIVTVVVVLAAVTGAVWIVRRKRQAHGSSAQSDNLSTTPSLPRNKITGSLRHHCSFAKEDQRIRLKPTKTLKRLKRRTNKSCESISPNMN